MLLILWLGAGSVCAVLAELLGLFRVYRFDVPRRATSLRNWRAMKGRAAFLFPLLMSLVYLPVGIAHPALLRQFCNDINTLSGLFGALVAISACAWWRVVFFACMPQHWREVIIILGDRGAQK